ncbi:MAG: protein adenylyltransferase SelO [Opitutus sp.]
MTAPAPSSPDALTDAVGWKLEHTYAQLPSLFHFAIAPTPVRAPRLVLLNRPLAHSLGLSAEELMGEEGAEIFAGNRLPPGASPLAQAYAGHQYGHFTVLGDGRAILLGEQITPRGERFDIQLKGSGPTPFSRRGDGRAALGPMLREYIISEAMHALGILTTRSLAVTATGETVWRQPPQPGAVLTRVAASHIRVGTFEWAAARQDEPALRALVDYTLRRHYPERVDAPNSAHALLEAVIERQAALIAQWLLVGFVHGVMNTDNMALSGETIDYGPCAFLDVYDPTTAFSSIDAHGRYAYANQPTIALWNLTRLAETLLTLFGLDEKAAVGMAEATLQQFSVRFQQHWLAGMRRKLGLFNEEPDDADLCKDLLDWMQSSARDYTLTFAELSQTTAATHGTVADETFIRWRDRWHARLERQPQSAAEAQQLRRASNPAVIPRNHLVEAALSSATQGDLGPMERLLDVLAEPFNHDRPRDESNQPPPPGGGGYQTFCGT